MISFEIEVTNAGGTYTYDPSTWGGGASILVYTTAPVTLAADFKISFSNSPPVGTTISIFYIVSSGNPIDKNGNVFQLGENLGASDLPQWVLDTQFVSLSNNYNGLVTTSIYCDSYYGNMNGGSIIADDSLPLTAIENSTAGNIIVYNGSGIATSVTASGDATISNTGVVAIGAGVIVNADVNASAAIARTKLASGTASHVIINDGSGVFSSEAQLAASRGGTALDTSASTGFALITAGTWSAATISEVINVEVSFEAAGGTVPSVGDFKVKLPYACTVTEIYAYATKAIAGTDNATIVAKNNAGTTMTSGTITFTASDARGTAYTVTPSANNTFAAGEVLTLTCAKATAGGYALLSIKVTRTS